METRPPLIKKFKTEKNYYIYDTWTNEILNVHKDFWDYLPDADHSQADEKAVGKIANLAEVQSEARKAQKLGFLSSDRPEVATYYGWPNWKEDIAFQVNHNLQQLSLNVTETCNFRCSYCAYSGHYKGNRTHSSQQMSWPVAQKAIDYAIQHSDQMVKNSPPLGISFYGGEPLCNFDLIKQCVMYCKEKFADRNIRFNMTTNGSLINEAIASFLVEHDFIIVFSIDGPDYLHDRYRKTNGGNPTHSMTMRGYQHIKKVIAEKHKRISISINCIMPPPFDLLAIEEFVNSIEEDVRLAQPSTFGTTFYNQFNIDQELRYFHFQRNKLFNNYKSFLQSNNANSRHKVGTSLFEKEILPIAKRGMHRMHNKTSSHGQCAPGARKLFVSCEGLFYPCEKVSADYCIGDVESGIDFYRVYQLLENWSKLFSEVCKNCWAIRFCSKCFANFDPSNSFVNNPLEKFCLVKKVGIEQNLIQYCSILELNPQSLDFMKNIMAG